MILTGKAKEDFLKWVKKRCNIKIHELIKVEMWFVIQDYAFKNALIIEWLDSVGIYINISVTYGFNWNINEFGGEDYNNRQESTKQAIIKANKIYNENRTN